MLAIGIKNDRWVAIGFSFWQFKEKRGCRSFTTRELNRQLKSLQSSAKGKAPDIKTD